MFRRHGQWEGKEKETSLEIPSLMQELIKNQQKNKKKAPKEQNIIDYPPC